MKLTATLLSATIIVPALVVGSPAALAADNSDAGTALLLSAQAAPSSGQGGDLSLPGSGRLPPLEGSDLTLPNSGEELDSGASELVLPDRNGQDPLLARRRGGDRIGELKPYGATVLSRPRPDYDALGIRTGGFTFFPALSVGLAGTTSAVPGGSSADLAGTVQAAAVARSDWSRHALALDGLIAHNSFLTYSSQDSTSWLARARGRLDIARTDSITGEISNERVVEARGAVGEFVRTGSPVHYTRTSAEIDAQGTHGRLNTLFHVGYRNQNYDDRISVDGVPVDQSRRDNERYEATVELGYQPNMPRTFFVSATRAWRNYRIESVPSRDETEWEFLAGIKGEVTSLIRGRLSLGYMAVDFDSPTYKSKSAFSFDTELEYLVTELTTINVRARRYTRSVSSATAPGALMTTLSVGADHELLRNLIVSSSLVYQSANYFDSNARNSLVGGDIEARWLISPRWRANLHFGSLHRVSHNLAGDERRYNAATLAGGITFQL